MVTRTSRATRPRCTKRRAAGQRNSQYETYLDQPSALRSLMDRWHLGPAEKLVQLYEAKGDAGKAAQHAGRLVELWADADPELQPRVAAARETARRFHADGAVPR